MLPLTLGASELAGELMANLAVKDEIIEYRDSSLFLMSALTKGTLNIHCCVA